MVATASADRTDIIIIGFDITTIVITHDMNSVMEIGDKVVFICNSQKWWEGSNETILHTDNKELLDFIYVSKFLKELRDKQNIPLK